jgi:hypothetical protein
MMEKALQNLIRLLKTEVRSWHYGFEQAFWRSSFEVIQPMPGSTVKFEEIGNECNREQLLDTLAEVKYAVIFSELGFQVEIEPLRNELQGANPDLRVSKDGYSSIVEVRRFRPSASQVPVSSTSGVLTEYGNPPRDWQKIFGEIEGKFRQAGSEGIIAFWNNSDNLESAEVESAAHAHALQASPRRSSFVLFRSYLDDEDFSCYKLRYRLPPHQEAWMTELERVNPRRVLFGPYIRKPRSYRE